MTNSSSQILESFSEAITKVAEDVAPSVVRVGAEHRVGGSGVIWSKDGQIVTNNHVVERLRSVEVGLSEERSFEAKVIGRDPYSDMALLKIDGDGFKPIKVGDSDTLKAGQFVLALANPLGEHSSVVSGIVTSPRHTFRGWWTGLMENVVVTDARLNPGYSGGPLVDASGRAVGLNVAYVSRRGIALPINTVKAISEKLAADGKIKRAYLGIVTNNISLPDDVASSLATGQDEGVIVLSVAPESPAKRAGLAIGDVILKLGDNPVRSIYDLHKLLKGEIIGSELKLSVLRGEKPADLVIKPSEAVF